MLEDSALTDTMNKDIPMHNIRSKDESKEKPTETATGPDKSLGIYSDHFLSAGLDTEKASKMLNLSGNYI